MASFVRGNAAGSGGFSSTVDIPIDLGSGANRALVVLGCTDRVSATTIDSAVVDGETIGALGAEFESASTAYKLRGFVLAGAGLPEGEQTVTVTCSDANVWMTGIACLYDTTDGGDPFSNYEEVPGATNGLPTADNVDSASGELAVFIGQFTGDSGQTLSAFDITVKDLDDNIASNAVRGFAFSEAGAALVTLEATVSASVDWAGIALSLKPAGGGGGGFQSSWNAAANSAYPVGA
jgi:hypothetical protein